MKAYKNLLQDQLKWCRANQELIIKKADKLYNLITTNPEKNKSLTKRCCDFKSMEKVLENNKKVSCTR